MTLQYHAAAMADAIHELDGMPQADICGLAKQLADLADRKWFQFPKGTDPLWQSYWNGGVPREGPVVRAVLECQQAVLWNGTVGIAPIGHDPTAELTVVPLVDMAPSRVVVAWNKNDANPLIGPFVEIATTAYRG